MDNFTAWDTVDWRMSDEEISESTGINIRTVRRKREIFTRKVSRAEVEQLLSKNPIFSKVKGWDE